MTNPDTRTCDACGYRYAFTSIKDRCPVCCPEQACENDASDNNEQEDWEYDDEG